MQAARNCSEFVLIRALGEGSFGRVCLMRHKGTGLLTAIKQLNRRRVIESLETAHVIQERRILQAMSCPFIVHLYGTFVDPVNVYFVLEVR